MSYSIRVLALSLMFVFKARCQNTVALIDEVVAQIKSEMVTCQKMVKVNAENGNRCLYYRNDEPIVVEVIEKGRIEKSVTWVFYKTKLIFSETMWTDTITGRTVHGEKTYHYEEAMIAWLDNESNFVEAASAEFVALDKSLRVYGRKIYREALED